MRAAKMIMAKGYDLKTSLNLAHLTFDEYLGSPGGMSIEDRIRRMLSKTEYDAEYGVTA